MSKIYNVRNFQQKRGCLRRYQSYQRACTTRLRKNVKSCVAMNVSMNNCYYSPRVERENRETKPEVRSSKVDKRNGALCTQREHALARRQKECVINSVKRGRRGRSVTKRLKSREECRVFISLHPWWCHCIASHSLCSLRTISNYERNRILYDVRTDNIQSIHFLQNERRNDFDHRLRF